MKQHLGAGGPETADIEALKLEVTELRTEVEKLTEQNKELQAKVNCILRVECNEILVPLCGRVVPLRYADSGIF